VPNPAFSKISTLIANCPQIEMMLPMSPLPSRPQKSSSAKTSTKKSASVETAEPVVDETIDIETAEEDETEDSPKLMRPVARPATPEPTLDDDDTDEFDESSLLQRPIPAPSEPMQYRAIGLVRGTYQPSEEQFTRGVMTTEDGTEVEAVLLGRVMSLVKNHLSLEKDHLWVVYPRTREKEETLHLQVVGVWEPESLNQAGAEPDDEAGEVAYMPSAEVEDNQFSIRGEVIFYSEEEKKTVIKIRQTLRKKNETEHKAFKLNLEGTLPSPKTIGYFWDLHVKRVDQALTIQDCNLIAIVPPQKIPGGRKRFQRRPGGFGGGRPGGFGGGRPGGFSGRPGGRPGGDRFGGGERKFVPAGVASAGPVTKPVKKRPEGAAPEEADS
jgi:CRISPR/Cas system-associated exonuclease Cas4 (RecB family)